MLVTGGAGFIGSHFIERLLAESQARITCLDNFNDFYSPTEKRRNIAGFAENPRVTLIEGDFCDAEAMQRQFDERQITAVVHLGAYAGVRPSVANPFIYEKTNVGGTLALLEAARRHPVERFLVWFREACATQDFFARRAVRRPAEWRNGEVAAEAFHGRAGSARSANSRRAPVAARRGRELGTRRC